MSFEHRHVAALDYRVTLHDADAPLVVESEVAVPADTGGQEGDPRRSRSFRERVLLPVARDGKRHRLILGHRTRNSGMTVVCGVDHCVESEALFSVDLQCGEDEATAVFSTRACCGQTFRITKYMVYHTSHTAVVPELRKRGVRTAVVTSSTNADTSLESAGIAGLFDAKVDGNVAREMGLPGKSAPDTYLEAARRLEVPPIRAVVIEDALSGVQAGASGGFGLVVGVARGTRPEELRRKGARIVVSDLGELLPENG